MNHEVAERYIGMTEDYATLRSILNGHCGKRGRPFIAGPTEVVSQVDRERLNIRMGEDHSTYLVLQTDRFNIVRNANFGLYRRDENPQAEGYRAVLP